METFLEKLATNCDNGANKEFVPHAKFYPSMDFLMYLKEDCSFRADRVDAFLTVLRHPTEDRLVGIKLKGFQFLFRRLKPVLELEEGQFLPLVKFLELTLVGGVAEQIMGSNDRAQHERLKELYKMAKAFVADTAVSPEEWKRAA